ncbi:hydrogenase maturation protease [Neptuniibacter sp. QD72_48]|uniref:hydrogenase maturation protease n=1 Tax=Neptuniibacter sp. QD72_48 TaxID=3398214 RepID=UPI0039F4BAE1
MKLGVLGLGSSHGDDQIGWVLVDALQGLLPESVVCEKLTTPSHSLVTLLPQFDQVIVIDACEMEQKAGEYRYIEDGSGFLHMQNAPVSSHTLGISESWQLLLKLEQSLPQISLFLVQLGQTETMAPISDCIAEQIPNMVEQLNKTVKLRCIN